MPSITTKKRPASKKAPAQFVKPPKSEFTGGGEHERPKRATPPDLAVTTAHPAVRARGLGDEKLLDLCKDFRAAVAAIERHEASMSERDRNDRWQFSDALNEKHHRAMEALLQVTPCTPEGLREKLLCIALYERRNSEPCRDGSVQAPLDAAWSDLAGQGHLLTLRSTSDDAELVAACERATKAFDQMWLDKGADPARKAQLQKVYEDDFALAVKLPGASTLAGFKAKAALVMTKINPEYLDNARPPADSPWALAYDLCENAAFNLPLERTTPCPALASLGQIQKAWAEMAVLEGLVNPKAGLAMGPMSQQQAAWQAKDRRNNSASNLLFDRLDALHMALATVECSSVGGAFLQVLTALSMATKLQDLEPGSEERDESWASEERIERLLSSAAGLLMELPEVQQFQGAFIRRYRKEERDVHRDLEVALFEAERSVTPRAAE